MELSQWQILIISGIISIITSILIECIASLLKSKNEIRKHILEERTKFYFEFFPAVDLLINHPEKVFDHAYMNEFLSYKARMKLLSSKKTFAAYQKLFELAIEPYNAFDIYDGYQKGEEMSNFDQKNFDKLDKKDFDLSEEKFLQKYLPDRKEIEKCILALYQGMRTDLGSNIK